MRKRVRCGDVVIGGGAPVSIQSMTNVDTRDVKKVTEQIRKLEEAGCEIVRLAVPDRQAAEAFSQIKKSVKIPLVADIHFDYRLAIAAIENGADKVRINPGNIGSMERVRAVAEAAKERSIPIRVGVNSGSLEKDILERNGGVTAEGLAESALRNVRLLEQMDFDDLVISLKASDVRLNYEAHKLIAEKTDHPIHIGITESGTVNGGKLKSAIGIGSLLLAGIGDTMRVSLTGDPVKEVLFAKEILKSIGIRPSGINLVSCPTCGRTQVDLEHISLQIEEAVAKIEPRREAKGLPPITVAVMGCAVNGPGEAKEADFGVAGGDGKGLLFAKGEILKTVPEDKIVEELIKLIEVS
ncbi:flavodoxin-dependent (E)-4-hydroxy-3-methylbut-2-enyl-diphosphate synthase [Aminipila luticellarii]|uniref:4-hydroxy-3-methylbut-2-en-1-yl diphosphate synthase (flavodoxin) n=1 Tax=Aminipila luticellarii TaxID=2507160 RepID=A0A410PW40_9FIRM|nr:flavodoxin-dependent (E)-4-hydroxy-3-methylbut-2-enyl-diphosphate synthase [Aminipila luticellarii]QAT43134.1 flavodoxin-dependent (E)-4-hydroxy-3-methylbut-2-enyl-diphosphate synthase [Aminipila luticellarii]